MLYNKSKKFKKNDLIVVIAGKDRGKQGKISRVFPCDAKILVEGVNIAKKHMKPNKNMPAGGIIAKEKPLSISNVAHIDPKTGVATRIGFKFLDNGVKVRYAKKSGELIDKV